MVSTSRLNRAQVAMATADIEPTATVPLPAYAAPRAGYGIGRPTISARSGMAYGGYRH